MVVVCGALPQPSRLVQFAASGLNFEFPATRCGRARKARSAHKQPMGARKRKLKLKLKLSLGAKAELKLKLKLKLERSAAQTQT